MISTLNKHKLNHLAIIMDGNARWAKLHGKTKAQGHKKGSEVAKSLLSYSVELGVKYLTLYAFSSENWQRPEKEVSILIQLLAHYVQTELKILKKHNIRLKIIGKLDKLSKELQKKISEAVETTKHHTKMTVTIAFSYGGKAEIVDACQNILNSGVKTIDEESFKQYLYDPEMPDVDLLIRPSGVYRISNFLLWQLAYAELYFTDKLWPDFGKEDLNIAIENYSQRKRNFGTRD